MLMCSENATNRHFAVKSFLPQGTPRAKRIRKGFFVLLEVSKGKCSLASVSKHQEMQ